jgi:hypothetical protein
VLIRLSIHDRIFGPEPPTPADLKRQADHERLVRAFPAAGETIDPTKCPAGQNRGGELVSYELTRDNTCEESCGGSGGGVQPWAC